MRYLEDLPLGMDLDCGSFTLTRDEIVAFAARFDPQPFHLDEAAAEASYFRGLCASGLHSQASAISLVVRRLSDLAVVAGGALHETTFFIPVRPDRRYDVTARWTHKRASARTPGRGVARIEGMARNEEGRNVMRFGVTYVIGRRPAGEAE